ncbi:MAG: hypothetical protein IJ324_10230, partial [Lachnospiraceae bacterium]|nr:hypothetical protein [Lachnospiraceae bacterium]
MAEEIQFIYDKIFKRILTLSTKAVVNLINGLFGTNYPENSKLTYNWTEFENDNLDKFLADTMITVNENNCYHMEAQMENDTDIVFRVFDYCFQHAKRERVSEGGTYILNFPEPKVIYLYSSTEIPEKYTLQLQFGKQGCFNYEVSTFNFLTTSLEDLNQKRLIILIPFQLLKLRKLLSKTRTPETIERLQKLLECDILNSINMNLEAGNISLNDSRILLELTQKLLRHLYARYPEMEEVCKMYDHSLDLEIDRLIDQFEELDSKIQKATEELSQKDEQLSQKDEQLSQKDEQLSQKDEQLSQKDEQLSQKDEQLSQ